MSEGVLIQIIVQLGGLAAAIVAALAARGSRAKAESAHTEARKAATGVAAVEAGVAAVKAETKTNHGSSMRDAIDRIEANQKSERGARMRLEVAIDGVASDVRGMRRDIGRLQDADVELRAEVAEVTKGLAEHLADVPKIIDQAFKDHSPAQD